MAELSDLTRDRQIREREDVVAFLADCSAALGGGFHPDNPGADYVTNQGEPSFTDAEAKAFDANMEAAFEVAAATGFDLYGVADVKASPIMCDSCGHDDDLHAMPDAACSRCSCTAFDGEVLR